MDVFVWSTIVLGVWAAVGPLVGVRYGHDLGKRWQKEHWISDNKKQEYRELLGVLTDSFSTIIQFARTPKQTVLFTNDETQKRHAAEIAALAAIQNRLFIANEIRKLNLLDRWVSATRSFEDNRDRAKFSDAFASISSDLRQQALKDI
jgi:hypothetical protein